MMDECTSVADEYGRFQWAASYLKALANDLVERAKDETETREATLLQAAQYLSAANAFQARADVLYRHVEEPEKL